MCSPGLGTLGLLKLQQLKWNDKPRAEPSICLPKMSVQPISFALGMGEGLARMDELTRFCDGSLLSFSSSNVKKDETSLNNCRSSDQEG